MSRNDTIGKHKTSVLVTGGLTTVVYHRTPVVEVNRNNGTITLDHGGWRSRTTLLRMNQASRQYGLGYSVYQKRGQWYVDHNGTITEYVGQVFQLPLTTNV
jgi:hypothetical protein